MSDEEEKPIPRFVRQLVEAGCAEKVASDVVAFAFVEGFKAGQNSKSGPLERIRKYDRERQAARRAECDEQTWILLRTNVFNRDAFTCVYCGATDIPLHCDHRIPFSRGGRSELTNLVTACGPCNSAKGDLTPEEWGGRGCR